MQRICWFDQGAMRSTILPSPSAEVVPGVQWGCPSEVLSPAFWALEVQDSGSPSHGFVVQQGSLEEEVGFCLLGGFGVKVELAEAYHKVLLQAGAYRKPFLSEAQLYELLSQSVMLRERAVHYRFPKQRAGRLAAALPRLANAEFQTHNPIELRGALLTLVGIGPKTASWIVRNWLGSDDVAILDIHVIRACQAIGLFPAEITLASDYEELEEVFLSFSKGLGVRASVLDAVIWNRMRDFTPTLIRKLT